MSLSKFPSSFPDRNVCIIGLGYVGLTLAVAMAKDGFNVHGVETNYNIIECLKSKTAHFSETGLNVVLEEQIEQGRFTFSSNLAEAPEATVYIVTVGTPVGDDKRTKMDSLIAVTNGIAARLRDGDLVMLRSTVRVGTCREVVKPILDATGKQYALAFCPERTLEGKALQELSSLPQIVGGIDAESSFRAAQIFSMLSPSVIRVSSLEAAEMVKLINNTQRDLIFAFANEVAAMCDAIGVSAAEVIKSGNEGYPRANLPLPGPVGGPCLEKDPYILAEGLEKYGFVPSLSLMGRHWNEGLPERAANDIRDLAGPDAESVSKVVVAGVAFKGRPATNDLRGTMALPLIAVLKSHFPGAKVSGWDAVATAEEVSTLGVSAENSLEQAFEGADVVVIQNNHTVFAGMDLKRLASKMSTGGIIYDLWSQHDGRALKLPNGVRYAALGALRIA